MALEMVNTFGADIESFKLIPGSGGEFEVTVNGELAYSKKATGVFPEVKQLRELLRSRLPSA